MKYPKSKKITRDMLALSGAEIISGYIKDGAIFPALSPVKLAGGLPQNISFACYAPRIKRYIAFAEGQVYLVYENFEVDKTTALSATRPFAFCSKEGQPYIAGDEECVSAENTLFSRYGFNHGIFGGVIKNGRLFAIDKTDNFIIRWSGGNGGLDWKDGIDGAGWIRVAPERGRILNLAVFKQKVVAVCEYGIAVLNAFGTPENFKLQYIDGVTAKIYANAACVAGEKLVFFTADGLRYFNGVKVEAPRFGLEKDIANPRFCQSADGIYFLCADSKNLGRRAIFTFDTVNSCGYIVDLSATAMLFKGNILCFADDGLYELKAGGKFTFLSGGTDFGARGRKALLSVFAGNEKPADIEVITDGKSRIVRGVSGYCLPCVSGNTFKIRISSDGEVHGLIAVAEAIDGI